MSWVFSFDCLEFCHSICSSPFTWLCWILSLYCFARKCRKSFHSIVLHSVNECLEYFHQIILNPATLNFFTWASCTSMSQVLSFACHSWFLLDSLICCTAMSWVLALRCLEFSHLIVSSPCTWISFVLLFQCLSFFHLNVFPSFHLNVFDSFI